MLPQSFGFCLFLPLLAIIGVNSAPFNETRIRRSVLREFAIAQPTAKTQELAKAICKAHCLKECLDTLQSKSQKDAGVSRFAYRSSLFALKKIIFIFTLLFHDTCPVEQRL